MSVTFDDDLGSTDGRGSGGGSGYLGAWTIERVCEHLSISRSTVYRMIACGDLERIRVGKRGSRITATSVFKFLSKKDD